MSEFRLERDMVGSAAKWLFDQGLMTKREFFTPWGICDLVGVSLDRGRVQQRLGFGQVKPIGPPLRIEILNRIAEFSTGKSTTFDKLDRLYKGLLTSEQLRAQLECLKMRKFIQLRRRDAFQKINGWAPLHKRIVALELKLTRVTEALAQAMSHLAFAEESFVGLPSGLAERVVNSTRAEDFRRVGVGIVSIGNKNCAILLPSKSLSPVANPILQMHCVERFWRTRPKDN